MGVLVNKIFKLSFLSFLLYPLSFLNQLVISHYFGTSIDLDIYWLLISIINLILFIEIPFKEGLIPEFMRKCQESKENGSLFLSRHLSFLFLLILILAIIFYLFKKEIIQLFLPGSIIRYLEKVISLIPFIIPILFFRLFSQIFSGILTALGYPYFNYIITYSLAFFSIIFVYLFSHQIGILSLFLAMAFGFFLILIFETLILKRKEINLLNFRPYLSKSVRNLVYSVSGGMGISQFVVLFQRFVYLYIMPGSVSAFQYAQSIIYLPINFISLPITSILTPQILENIKNKDANANLDLFLTWVKRIIVILGLFSFLSLIFSEEVMFLIYSRGKFDSNSLELTMLIFKIIGISIPFIVILDLMTKYLTLYEEKKNTFIYPL